MDAHGILHSVSCRVDAVYYSQFSYSVSLLINIQLFSIAGPVLKGTYYYSHHILVKK